MNAELPAHVRQRVVLQSTVESKTIEASAIGQQLKHATRTPPQPVTSCIAATVQQLVKSKLPATAGYSFSPKGICLFKRA